MLDPQALALLAPGSPLGTSMSPSSKRALYFPGGQPEDCNWKENPEACASRKGCFGGRDSAPMNVDQAF